MKITEDLNKEALLDLKTMIVFHKAARTIRAIEAQIFKKHDLTPTQFSVLETLYSKGELRIQDLIDRILATSGNMTVVIKKARRSFGSQVRTIQPSRSIFLMTTVMLPEVASIRSIRS